jgi:hypothetical protein
VADGVLGLGVSVAARVQVGAGVLVGVSEGIAVGVRLGVSAGVDVAVAFGAGVSVNVAVAVAVGTGVSVGMGMSVGITATTAPVGAGPQVASGSRAMHSITPTKSSSLRLIFLVSLHRTTRRQQPLPQLVDQRPYMLPAGSNHEVLLLFPNFDIIK